VGGDIVAGLLCTPLAAESAEPSLFIDIGTNGEMVVGCSDFLLGCACSAGPAFEGGGITAGMRASQGAIENVEIDKETGLARYATIGSLPPKGICGSGMIALVAGLFAASWIDSAGKLDRSGRCSAIAVDGRSASYTVAPAGETASGRPLAVSEVDIDNIIRAKAAIFSACRTLLAGIELDFSDLARIYIAGGFGRYLDISKAKIIGLVPDLPAERFHYIGNASLTGAYMALVSRKHRERQYELANKITYVDLSSEPGYMDQYTAALFLPHTDTTLFPSVV
jgi:uncharacterized 2Fe-2S/4Fe-4S cluster protein (DUF4445 family)